MTIRPAKLSDVPFLAEYWYDQIALQSQKTRALRLAPDATAQWEAYANDLLKTEARIFLVAETDGEILGGIVAQTAKNDIGLLPEQFGLIVYLILDLHSPQGQQNTAGALVEAVKEIFRKNGLQQCRITVASHALVEQGFWRGLGANLFAEDFWMAI